MDEIVMRALSRDPADRFADSRAFQQALLEFMYPSTPDVVRDSLKHFMHELFEEEIASERGRLRDGSEAAVKLWESAPELDLEEEWAEEAGSARTMQTAPSRVPMVLAGIAVLLALGVAAFFALREPVTKVVEVEKAVTTGAVHLRITPDDAPARVFLDGAPVGEGSAMVLVEGQEPGADLALRVEAEGYETWEDTIDLVAGERLRLKVALQEPTGPTPPPVERPDPPPEQVLADPDPQPTEDPAAPPPTAKFRSTPSGAQVYVNGRLVGRTPVDWDGGSPGGSAKVEYRLDGYSPTSFSAKIPAAGESESYPRTLKQRSAVPGKVSVNVKSGWANVFIDGKQVDTTPLFNHALSPGKHTVRVVNEATGVDETRSVTITSGETSSVTF
jgi:hypothetical protein